MFLKFGKPWSNWESKPWRINSRNNSCRPGGFSAAAGEICPAIKVADSSGAELTGGKLLAGSLVMKRLLYRHVFSPEENMVGVLLPPTVAGAVINAAIALSRKVAVNLNYTLSEKDINYCIREAGIKHIITSRKFMEKLLV